MRAARFFLLLLFAWPAQAQSVAGAAFPAPLAGQVFTAAYAFIAPRSLESVPIPRLALWLLRGLAVMDPALAVTAEDGEVTLRVGGQMRLSRAAPAADDAEGWGEVTAALAESGFEASALVRRGGAQGRRALGASAVGWRRRGRWQCERQGGAGRRDGSGRYDERYAAAAAAASA